MTRRRALAPLLAAAVLGATGCGLGAGPTPADSSLIVTRDFGSTVLVLRDHPAVHGSDTVMRLLQRNARVGTKFGGKFVQSVNGVAGGTSGGDPVDWFFYVNGVEGTKGAADVRVHPGDHVWWDRHDWAGSMDTPAVVGSFPEPFTNGIRGKRLPVRVECVPATSTACDDATNALVAVGVDAAQGGLGESQGTETLRMLVGTWTTLRLDSAARQLESSPAVSGVFARIAPSGRSIALLDADGRRVRTLGPGAGLVAAVSLNHAAPVWVVTGTNAAGIRAAADSLQQGLLADHFAVAVDHSTIIPLPVS